MCERAEREDEATYRLTHSGCRRCGFRRCCGSVGCCNSGGNTISNLYIHFHTCTRHTYTLHTYTHAYPVVEFVVPVDVLFIDVVVFVDSDVVVAVVVVELIVPLVVLVVFDWPQVHKSVVSLQH